MLRKLIATALLPAAAAGAVALANTGTASAAPWICTSGKASATQLASPMCTGASGSESGGSRPVPEPAPWAGYDAPVLDYADVPVLDENGDPVLDADGNPVTETVLVGSHSEHFPQTPAWQQ